MKITKIDWALIAVVLTTIAYAGAVVMALMFADDVQGHETQGVSNKELRGLLIECNGVMNIRHQDKVWIVRCVEKKEEEENGTERNKRDVEGVPEDRENEASPEHTEVDGVAP